MEKRKISQGKTQKKRNYKTPEIYDLDLKNLKVEGAGATSTTSTIGGSGL
ncbi:MAG: hypothetical protein PHG31_02105 [Candidatus Omnitrophica bacterium]|nr:hypothetical protein [Candidatus Omnitrophota bacterium]